MELSLQLCVNNLEVSLQQFINNQDVVMTHSDLKLSLGQISLASQPQLKTNTDVSVKLHLVLKLRLGGSSDETNTEPSSELKFKLAQMLQDPVNSDFEIECQGEVFKVHKFILAMRSSVFKTMFRNSGYYCSSENQTFALSLSHPR